MSIEAIGEQLALWFKALLVDTFRAWLIIYCVATVLAYHLGV